MKVFDNTKGVLTQEENANRIALDQILRQGAQQMLQKAIQWEVEEYMLVFKGARNESGRQLVVRNGWRDPRSLQTGLGDIEICQPRVNDRREGKRFISNILPAYMRRAPSI